MKEDWLDNVTEEQLIDFFEKSKLAKIKELKGIKIIPDEEGNKVVFFNYDAYSRSMDVNEIAIFDAFGQVRPFQKQYNYARMSVFDKDLLAWHHMVSSANQGRLIDGQTYDDAFIEYYQGINNESYQRIIDAKQVEITAYINAKIRANRTLREIVENNSKIIKQDLEFGE